MGDLEVTTRFSDRVEAYIQSRPGYPREVYQILRARDVVQGGEVVADIGSGTGLSARLFLEVGHRVYGIEPNPPMREAGQVLLAEFPLFVSVDGRAEATTLETDSVDLVVAGQAFHWFEPRATAEEWRRILRPGGSVVLMWNDRRLATTGFLMAYEDLLRRRAVDYSEVNHQNLNENDLRNFLGEFESFEVPNSQHFDLPGLRARAASSSYVPAPGHPLHAPFYQELDEIFTHFATGGRVQFEYDTRVFIFPLSR